MRLGTVTSFFDLPTVAQQGERVKADHPLGDAIETFMRTTFPRAGDGVLLFSDVLDGIASGVDPSGGNA
jgi:hypothetical protein